MKNPSILLSLCLCWMPLANAAPLGGTAYPVDKLDEAASSAKLKKLPLLFVSNASSNDSAKSAVRIFRNEAVIILLERGDFKAKGLTPRLLGAFVKEAKQVPTPLLVFASSDQSKIFAILPGETTEDNDAVKKFKESLPVIMADTQAATVLPDTSWCWQSSDPAASGWVGAFSHVGPGDVVVLKNAAGKKFQVPFSKLVPHHVEFAKSLGATPEPYVSRVADAYEEPGVEAWTNLEGKEVRGTFISADRNVLTLTLENGKEAKVPFEKLSSESRIRARALGIRKALRPKN
jgi:hypothetical protein